MKIFISADIEGVTGVTHWDETELSKPEGATAREQMTAEVAAACEGAIQAGVTEVWVKDSHDSGRNLIGSRLPVEARLIRGWSGSPLMMLQELDGTFNAVALIGYHSRAGAGTNPLAHTLSGTVVYMRLNGSYVSEFLIDAYTSAYVKVPLVFVSGDKGLCDEIARFHPQICTVAVKEGIGDSTINIHPTLATARICEGMAQALRGDLSRCLIPLPEHFSLEVFYRHSSVAYRNSFYPGAKLVEPRTILFETTDYFEVLRFLLFAVFSV